MPAPVNPTLARKLHLAIATHKDGDAPDEYLAPKMKPKHVGRWEISHYEELDGPTFLSRRNRRLIKDLPTQADIELRQCPSADAIETLYTITNHG